MTLSRPRESLQIDRETINNNDEHCDTLAMGETLTGALIDGGPGVGAGADHRKPDKAHRMDYRPVSRCQLALLDS